MAQQRRSAAAQQRPAQSRSAPAQQQRSAARPAPRPAAPPARERDPLDELYADDESVSSIVMTPDNLALEALTRSEVSMQLDAAHRWPRHTLGFVEEASALASYSPETAASCTFTLMRKEWDPRTRTQIEKPIVGPSVRLAEIVAPCWGNLHTGARIIEEGERSVTAQAVAWDLEKNLRVSFEVKRNILTRDGKRFSDDMIRVTSMAAISIAFRNAVFRIVPRALVNAVWDASRAAAVGPERDLPERRAKTVAWFTNPKRGIPVERVLQRVGVASIDEMTREHVEILIGLATSIKDNIMSIDEAFPQAQPGPRPVAKSAALDDLTAQHGGNGSKSNPPPANDAPAPAADGGALTDEKVIDALVDADESWSTLSPAAGRAIVESWSAANKLAAYNWALAFVATPEDQPPPEQPEFTFVPADPERDGR